MKKLAILALSALVLVGCITLSGCSSKPNTAENVPVYNNTFPLEEFKGPGDYLWEKISGE